MNILKILFFITVCFLVGCKSGQDHNPLEGQLTISTRLSESGDNTVVAQWEEGDRIALFFGDEGETEDVLFSYEGGQWKPSRTVTAEEMEGVTYLEACAPWVTGESSRHMVSMPVKDGTVDQTTYSNYHSMDRMVSSGNDLVFNNQTYQMTINFRHLLSHVRIIYAYSDELLGMAQPTDVKILNLPDTYIYDDGKWQYSGVATSILPLLTPDENCGRMDAVVIPSSVASGQQFMSFRVGEKQYHVNIPHEFSFVSGKSHTLYLAIGHDKVGIISGDIDDWDDSDLGSTMFSEHLEFILGVFSQWQEGEFGNGGFTEHLSFILAAFQDWKENHLGEGSFSEHLSQIIADLEDWIESGMQGSAMSEHLQSIFAILDEWKETGSGSSALKEHLESLLAELSGWYSDNDMENGKLLIYIYNILSSISDWEEDDLGNGDIKNSETNNNN